MKTHRRIEDQFLIFFTANTEAESLAALDKLMELGLTEQQVLEGVETGCDHIKKESAALKLAEVKMKRRVS
jgi:hypothetical protein